MKKLEFKVPHTMLPSIVSQDFSAAIDELKFCSKSSIPRAVVPTCTLFCAMSQRCCHAKHSVQDQQWAETATQRLRKRQSSSAVIDFSTRDSTCGKFMALEARFACNAVREMRCSKHALHEGAPEESSTTQLPAAMYTIATPYTAYPGREQCSS